MKIGLRTRPATYSQKLKLQINFVEPVFHDFTKQNPCEHFNVYSIWNSVAKIYDPSLMHSFLSLVLYVRTCMNADATQCCLGSSVHPPPSPTHTHTKVRDLFSLGSMVQKGKFSAGADAFVRTLKKVDFLSGGERHILPSSGRHST